MNDLEYREMEEQLRRALHAVADLVVDDPPPRRTAGRATPSRARAKYESPRAHLDDIVAPPLESAPSRMPAGRVLTAIVAAVAIVALVVAALVAATSSSDDSTRVQSPAGRGGGVSSTAPAPSTSTPAGAGMVTVPNVVGTNAADAVAALQAAGLNGTSGIVMSSMPAGTVVTQDQPAGTRVAAGTMVQLSVSRGS